MPGHFVVGTSKPSDTAWGINDPGPNNMSQLQTTQYTSHRKYNTIATEPTQLTIVVHSPIELVITDPAGRRTGHDPISGQSYAEILDATYGVESISAQDGSTSTIDSLVFSTGAPLSGTYSVQMFGTGNGAYQMDVMATDAADGVSTDTLTGTVTTGQQSTLALDYSTAPGSAVALVHRTYLPLVMRNADASSTGNRIHGQVTYQGTPLGGVNLALRFYNGSSWSTPQFAATQADGTYRFDNLSSLSSGQRYYVSYLNGSYGNTSNPNYLSIWGSFSITTLSNGADVSGGNFDLANVPLIAPTDNATVALPYTFQWTRRAASPSDSYELDLWDPDDGDPYWWTSLLGWVNGYTLNALPAGFVSNTPYAWEVYVISADGGYGLSYQSRLVTFSNTGSLTIRSSGAIGSAPPDRLERLEERLIQPTTHSASPAPRRN
jgi:hypothetical protein